jgi:hypothetical protein
LLYPIGISGIEVLAQFIHSSTMHKLCFSVLSPSKHQILLSGKQFANRVNILTTVHHEVAHIGASGDADGVCCLLHH